jgi:hypothetical protein
MTQSTIVTKIAKICRYFGWDIYSGNISNAHIICLSLLAAAFFFLNPGQLRHNYGDMNGKYDEKGDSFIEFRARNTIKNHILGFENKGIFLVITKGYPLDYDYYPDGTHIQRTGLYAHVYLAGILAKALGLQTEQSIDKFIVLLRLMFAFLLSFTVLQFARLTTKFCSIRNDIFILLALYLTITSFGFVLFSMNLYHAYSIYLLPLPLIIYFKEYTNYKLFNILLIFLSFIISCRSFTHIPVFVIMITSTILMFSGESVYTVGINKKIVMNILNVLLYIGIGITMSLILFIFFNFRISTNLSLLDSLKESFSFLSMLDNRGMPEHYSFEFLKTLWRRWEWPAFYLWPFNIKIKEKYIIIAFIICFLLRINKLTRFEYGVFLWSFCGYFALYILQYRYIMRHTQMDWPLFSITFSLSLLSLIIFYSRICINTYNNVAIIKKYNNS